MKMEVMSWPCSWDPLPFAVIGLVECANVGLSEFVKVATSRGMSNFVFIFYSYALATLVLLPLHFIFHRRTTLAPLNFSLLCKLFLLGLVGFLGKIFSYTGIKYSSPTLFAAMSNLIPGFTFILAIIFRMEKLHLRSSSCLAKCIGTLVSIGGAFVVNLYKGPTVLMTTSQQSNWALGGLFMSAYCLCLALLYILQTSVVKVYPAEFTLNVFYCFFATIQSGVVSVVVERDLDAWTLRPDIELIAIVYSAIIWYGLGMVGYTWGLRKKGPLFVAMFKPLKVIIAIIMGIIFLGDTLHLGSVIGSIIIVLGFYGVMWGKSKEEKLEADSSVNCLESSTQQAPLLQSNKETQEI